VEKIACVGSSDLSANPKELPAYERFGLVSQMQRSAVSIPANLVEGFKRRSSKEFLRHINIAQASLEELKYYLILCRDLKLVKSEEIGRVEIVADEVGKIMYSLEVKIKSKSIQGSEC